MVYYHNIMENGQAARLLKKAYEELKLSNAEQACILLEQALDIDFENYEIKHALKCVHWWLEHTRRIDEINNPYEKGSFLISLLKQYFVFLEQLEDISDFVSVDQCQYSVRYFVYSKALFYLKGLLTNKSNQNDSGLLLLIGRCCKGLGNYEEALSFLEQAFSLKRDNAEILAEVADVNALLSDTRTAKTLFREAFFTDPSAIEMKSLESALIVNLVKKVEELGYKDKELNEWIPIYGFLWGIFSVKRELKQMEASRLKQSIFSLEIEYEANPSKKELLKPRLLNHYFWVLDHYEKNREDSALIEETLLKIKVIDPDIYKLYTGS